METQSEIERIADAEFNDLDTIEKVIHILYCIFDGYEDYAIQAAEEYAALKARAENAEAVVIEVDALSQADKQPRSYEEASLVVVRMMAEGVTAMNELQNAEAERDALKVAARKLVLELNEHHTIWEVHTDVFMAISKLNDVIDFSLKAGAK